MWRSTLCLHSADTRRAGGSRGKAISVTERRTAFRATVLFYSAIFQSSIVKGYVVQGYVVQGSIAQALG